MPWTKRWMSSFPGAFVLKCLCKTAANPPMISSSTPQSRATSLGSQSCQFTTKGTMGLHSYDFGTRQGCQSPWQSIPIPCIFRAFLGVLEFGDPGTFVLLVKEQLGGKEKVTRSKVSQVSLEVPHGKKQAQGINWSTQDRKTVEHRFLHDLTKHL